MSEARKPRPEEDEEERLATSWDETPLPLQFLDCEGSILRVNAAWEQLTGYTEEEVAGTSYSELVPEDRLPEFAANWERLNEHGILEGIECFLKHKSGGVRDVLIFSRLQRDNGSCVARCMLVDTTKLKEYERALTQSEARFRHLFELAPTPIVIHNGQTLVLSNDAAARFLGAERAEDIIGKPIVDFVHPDSLPQVSERVKRMLTEDWVAPLADECYVRLDGSSIWGETVAAPIALGDRRLIYVIAVDSSSKRETEQALRDSEASFRTLFESSADAIVVHDGVEVVLANDAAKKQFRLGPDDGPEGLLLTEFVHPNSADLAKGRIAALLGGTDHLAPTKMQLFRRDGSTWEAEVATSALVVGGNRVFHSTFRDITERTRTERELARYRRELERLVDERTRSLDRARANLAAVSAVIGRTVEMRDPYVAGHQARVAELCVAIAEEMGMDRDDIDALNVAAEMHDIGKMSIPSEILSKPAALTELEYELVKTHVLSGYEIVASAELEGPVAEMVYQHHERLDGSGYPRGLRDESLLPPVKVLMVADVFEAMASHRPYRPALGVDAALEELVSGRGTRYDARVVDACVKIVRMGFTFTTEVD